MERPSKKVCEKRFKTCLASKTFEETALDFPVRVILRTFPWSELLSKELPEGTFRETPDPKLRFKKLFYKFYKFSSTFIWLRELQTLKHLIKYE